MKTKRIAMTGRAAVAIGIACITLAAGGLGVAAAAETTTGAETTAPATETTRAPVHHYHHHYHHHHRFHPVHDASEIIHHATGTEPVRPKPVVN